MKGIYVYGIISSQPEKLNSPGVEFGSEIKIFEYKELKAAISEIDKTKISKEMVEEKLHTDLDWTQKNVKAHHQVIMELEQLGTVIPLRFGTIFYSLDNLRLMMKDYYKRFLSLLKQLENKQEVGVKVFFNYEKAKESLRLSDKEVARTTANAMADSRNMRWYWEKKSESMLREKISDNIEEKLRHILDTVEKKAIRSSLSSPYPLENDQKKGEMVLNGAFLISDSYVGNFSRSLDDLSKEMEKDGFSIEVTGPWPPYNFVNISSK